MPTFTGNSGHNLTPNTASDLWVLDANAATELAKVISIGWGGSHTTSTGYRTRWARPTTVAQSTFTSLSPETTSPNAGYASPTLQFGTFLTNAVLPTESSSAAKNLHVQHWNVHGGLGFVVLPLANPWWVSGAGTAVQQVACRNTSGTDASMSAYQVTWEEV